LIRKERTVKSLVLVHIVDEGKDDRALPSYHLLRAIKEEVTAKLANPTEYVSENFLP